MIETFWNIEVLPTGRSLKVKLNSPENYAPLRAFFFEAVDSDYPRIIATSLQKIGIGLNSAGVNFPGDFEPDEDLLPKGYVQLYDPIAEVDILEQEFLLVLLDVATEVLKTSLKRGTVDSTWQSQMQTQIEALAIYLATLA